MLRHIRTRSSPAWTANNQAVSPLQMVVSVRMVTLNVSYWTSTVTRSVVSHPRVRDREGIRGGGGRGHIGARATPRPPDHWYWKPGVPPCTLACNCTGLSGQNTKVSGVACTTRAPAAARSPSCCPPGISHIHPWGQDVGGRLVGISQAVLSPLARPVFQSRTVRSPAVEAFTQALSPGRSDRRIRPDGQEQFGRVRDVEHRVRGVLAAIVGDRRHDRILQSSWMPSASAWMGINTVSIPAGKTTWEGIRNSPHRTPSAEQYLHGIGQGHITGLNMTRSAWPHPS